MVPVLSSRMTSTSPEASTARPLIASTLKRATRSIPAMPMADRRPPIVVGMRHTSRAVRATVSTVVPAYSPNGRSVTVAIRNTIDSPASRIASAISFGVRCDADHEPVADEGRTAGDRAPDVRAGLLEDGRGLAGDRGLVDEADTL